MRPMSAAEFVDFDRTAPLGLVAVALARPSRPFEPYRSLREYAAGGVTPRVDAPAWDPEPPVRSGPA